MISPRIGIGRRRASPSALPEAAPGASGSRPLRLQLRDAWRRVQNASVTYLALLSIAVLLISAVGVLMVESGESESNIHGFGDALWYSIVTMATVGYGDLTPKTTAAKAISVVLMLSGMGFLSLFTATIASTLVTRRLKEEQGLDTIRWRNHILVCGWNQYGERVLQGLVLASTPPPQIVLVNEGPDETAQDLIRRYHNAELHHVHGDPAAEASLERANVREARAAIVLADMARNPAAAADDRTALLALAIKSLKPDIKITAEALDMASEAHLRRAGVDDIIISGEFNGFMLSSAALSPGMSQVIRRMLSFGTGELSRHAIPPECVGRPFAEVFQTLRQRSGFLTLAIVTETKAVTLDDLLTDDYSLIDQFIRNQFSEAGTEYLRFEEGAVRVQVNPSDSYVIQPEDAAIGIPRAS